LAIGATQMLSYTATGTYSDGTTAAVDGAWSLANAAIGSIDPVSGVFAANGIVGGGSDVQFTLMGLDAVASLTVNLSAMVALVPSPVPGPDMLFAAAGTPVKDTTAQANIVYPLDLVRFPQNVNAPLTQWQIGDGSGAGGASDWYRITYSKT